MKHRLPRSVKQIAREKDQQQLDALLETTACGFLLAQLLANEHTQKERNKRIIEVQQHRGVISHFESPRKNKQTHTHTHTHKNKHKAGLVVYYTVFT
jgi:hypothetical protein